jgi:hypothetical protein
MSLFRFPLEVLHASVFMIIFSIYEDSVTGNLLEGAKNPSLPSGQSY